MSDLVLGPVIGKLGGGGAEISEIPVSFTSPSGKGVKHVVDVPVPEGVTARVVVVGSADISRGSYRWPMLIIGGQDIGLYHESVGGSATVTGPTVVEVKRRSTQSSRDPSFVGTVYWWEEVDEVVITGTSRLEARDNFRAALSARGLDYRTVETVPFLLDTSNVTNMSYMFNGCSSLTTVPNMDTSNVTNMRTMFQNCSSLTSVPNMDTSNVTTMLYMFWGCSSLTTVPDMDTSNVTNMRTMFDGCSSLTTVPNMDTSNVTTMRSMFYDCSSLTTVPDMDTSNVTNMRTMFYGCSALTDGNVRLIGKKRGVNTDSMIDNSGLTRLPFYDTNGNWTG